MDRFTVIRDSREKDGHGWFFDEDNYCTGTLVQKLDTGDYSAVGLENILCIERKESVAEVAQNITSQRFKDELNRMLEYKYRFLICEFTLENVIKFPLGSSIPKAVINKLKITPAFLLRCISELQIKYGVHIVFAGNNHNAKTVVTNIIKRAWENERKR